MEMSQGEQPKGSAGIQGQLWSARPRDWAELEDEGSRPIFEAVLDATGVGKGTNYLDVGCGSGLACAIAEARGARVSGLDAASGLLAIASERVPSADFRVGDMQFLPYEDDAFDVVTLFNCIFFAEDQVATLREAARVAKPGAKVAVQIWGRPEQVQAGAFLGALGPLLPPAIPELKNLFHQPGAPEDLAKSAGLNPERGFDVDCPWEYPDLATLQRGWLSAGPATLAIQTAGEEAVKNAIATAVELFRTPQGGYRLENVFYCLIARA